MSEIDPNDPMSILPPVETTKWICDKHGEQDHWQIYAGIDFCTICIRNALLGLGLRPLNQRKERKK